MDEIRHKTRPIDKMSAKWRDATFLHLSAFSFGNSGFSTVTAVLLLPVLVLNIAPENAKNTYVGILGLAGLIVALIIQPLTGHISDRTSLSFGRRTPYILIGGFLTSLSILSLGLSSSFYILLSSIIFIQLCVNTALGPYYALIRDLAPKARRGVVSSFKLLADSSGSITLLVALSFLLDAYATTGRAFWLWISLGTLSITISIMTAWTCIGIYKKEVTVAVHIPKPKEQSQGHPATGFRWFLASRLCAFAALGILQSYALFFLRDVVGLQNPIRDLGTMTIFIGGALFLSVYPSGKLSDQTGRKKVILAASMAAGAGTFALLIATTSIHVILIGSLIGASAGAFLSASWAMATDMASSTRTGQQMGIANGAALVGMILARLAGPGVDILNNIQEGLGYWILLGSCGLLFIIAAMLLMPVPDTRSSELK